MTYLPSQRKKGDMGQLLTLELPGGDGGQGFIGFIGESGLGSHDQGNRYLFFILFCLLNGLGS